MRYSTETPKAPAIFTATSAVGIRYSRMIEGFGYGRMNNEGFNNLEDYKRQIVDLLIMGSSRMEAFQVPQQKTAAALLNRLFGNTKHVYNIGISSRSFPRVVNNFETAVEYYDPEEYLIIETGSVQFAAVNAVVLLLFVGLSMGTVP